MAKTTFSAIAAMASNRVIGADGQLPWHLPEDLKFFKKVTTGHPIVMGRTTFDSIGRSLPGRRNIVISSKMEERQGVEIVRNLSDLDVVLGDSAGEVFVIGGAKVYQALLPRCSRLYLTYLRDPYEGDTFFPEFEGQFSLESVLGEGEGFEFRLYTRNSGTD